jgi:hypothetical protein
LIFCWPRVQLKLASASPYHFGLGVGPCVLRSAPIHCDRRSMSDEATFEAELNAMRTALARGPQPDDIANIVPVIVPRTFFGAGNWPGPHVNLRHKALGLTWAVLADGQAMVYVNHERTKLWAQEGVDWRERALANLVDRSRTSLWTHEKTDDSGKIVFVAMMQADGLGSSRALLHRALRLNLKTEFRIGLPDRSSAVIFPKSITVVERSTPDQMIAAMYNGAATPLCRDILEAHDLEVEA